MCGHFNVGLYGVVLAVYCPPTKKFLMLKELRDKPKFFKRAGMLAFPSETREEKDCCVCKTVNRLVHEEIGVEFSSNIILLPQPLMYFRHHVPVYVAWTEVQKEFEAYPKDTDVEYHDWVSELTIREMSKSDGKLRIETIDVLTCVSEAIARAPSHV